MVLLPKKKENALRALFMLFRLISTGFFHLIPDSLIKKKKKRELADKYHLQSHYLTTNSNRIQIQMGQF